MKSDYFHALGTLKLHPSSLDVDPICSRSGQFMCCFYVKSLIEHAWFASPLGRRLNIVDEPNDLIIKRMPGENMYDCHRRKRIGYNA